MMMCSVLCYHVSVVAVTLNRVSISSYHLFCLPLPLKEPRLEPQDPLFMPLV